MTEVYPRERAAMEEKICVSIIWQFIPSSPPFPVFFPITLRRSFHPLHTNLLSEINIKKTLTVSIIFSKGSKDFKLTSPVIVK
ncbi:hypothetical protein L6452_21831 [Arctium lappa]|uniref:Uncharacterized protein n=1 Tax=Arctium lappa TaxID=4217 RepID=A0ACB9AYS7_ARCLA|nr:hypothetical protein L6452_21831 [Arctium lappa]